MLRDLGRSIWGACLFAVFLERGLGLYRTDWAWLVLSYVLSSLMTGALWLVTEGFGSLDSTWAKALLFPLLLDVVALMAGIWFRFSERWRLFFVNYCWLSVPVYLIGFALFPIPPFTWDIPQGLYDVLSTVFFAYYLALTWFQIRWPLATGFGQTLGVFAAFLAVLVADWLLASMAENL